MSSNTEGRGNTQPAVTDTTAGAQAESGEMSFDAIDDAELDAIMDRLQIIAGDMDSPPPIVAELAKAAFETRDLDAELALLTSDTAYDELELVRSVATEPRMVSFETDEVTVELQLDRTNGESLTIRGLVVGAVGDIVLDTGDQHIPTQLDDRGWFLVEDVPVGALRLRIHGAEGANVTTQWIVTGELSGKLPTSFAAHQDSPPVS